MSTSGMDTAADVVEATMGGNIGESAAPRLTGLNSSLC